MTSNLTPRARAHLRALAHPLHPLVIVGADGLTEAVCRATQVALEDHELVKVRLGPSFTGDRREAAHRLAEATRSALAQLVGRVVVLYRRRARDDAKRQRIVLP